MDLKTHWAQQTHRLAESILVTFLQADTTFLGAAPDIIFDIIAFAAGFVVGVKFILHYALGQDDLGPTDVILSRCMSVLSQVSFSPDHAAKTESSSLATDAVEGASCWNATNQLVVLSGFWLLRIESLAGSDGL